MERSHVDDFSVAIDLNGFHRGGTLTATSVGYVNLGAFTPVVTSIFGSRVRLHWRRSALIEPYRSRAP
jgi:hypothetical protein